MLIVGFSRNPAEFPIMDVVQLVPTERMSGYYLAFNPGEAARIITSNDAEHLWAPGDPRPTGVGNLNSFTNVSFMTQRRAYAWTTDWITEEQASWPIIAQQSQNVAQQAMTARTLLAVNALTSTSWGNNYAATATAIGTQSGGSAVTGPWNTSTSTQLFIRQSVWQMRKLINKATLGVVRPKDLIFWMSPDTATAIMSSGEMQDTLKQSPYAMPQLKGEGENIDPWSILSVMYGSKMVIDDAVIVTTPKGATTQNNNYVIPYGAVFCLSRKGGIQGIYGAPSYSTLQMFYYKDEMTSETFNDTVNRRYMGSVVSNYQMVVTSPYVGFYCANVFA